MSEYNEFVTFSTNEDKNPFEATQIFCKSDLDEYSQQQVPNDEQLSLSDLKLSPSTFLSTPINQDQKNLRLMQSQLGQAYKVAQLKIQKLKEENNIQSQLNCELLESEHYTYHDNIDKIEKMLSALREENEYLRMKLNESQNYQHESLDELEKIKGENRILQNEKQQILLCLENVNQQHQKLTSVNQYIQYLTKLFETQKNMEIEQLNKELIELKNKISEKTQRSEQQNQEELNQQKLRINTLETEKEKLICEVKSLQQQMEQYSVEIKQLQDHITELNRQMEQIRIKCNKQVELKLIAQLKNEVKQSKEQLILSEQNKALFESKTKQYEQVVNQQKDFMSQQYQKFEQVQSEFVIANQQRQDLEKLLKDKEDEYNNVIQKIKQYQIDQTEMKNKLIRFENCFSKLGSIFSIDNIEDDQSIEKIVQKIENVESTNNQIKQRIKILADVISKQDNTYKNKILKLEQVQKDKDCYLYQLEMENQSQQNNIQELQCQLNSQSKEFNDCCEALQMMNKDIQNFQMQIAIIEQEKEDLKSDLEAYEFHIQNLSALIFNQETRELIQNVQMTYQKILDLKSLIRNFVEAGQSQENIRAYENEIKIYSHKLNAQMKELSQLRKLESEKYQQMSQNQKDCLSLARELEFIKQQRPAAISLHNEKIQKSQLGQSYDTFCGISSKPTSNTSSALNNRQTNENNSHQLNSSFTISRKQKPASQSQSLLGQFLSIRSQHNTSVSPHQKSMNQQ